MGTYTTIEMLNNSIPNCPLPDGLRFASPAPGEYVFVYVDHVSLHLLKDDGFSEQIVLPMLHDGRIKAADVYAAIDGAIAKLMSIVPVGIAVDADGNEELYAPDPVDGHNVLLDLPQITDEEMIASGWTKQGDEWVPPANHQERLDAMCIVRGIEVGSDLGIGTWPVKEPNHES